MMTTKKLSTGEFDVLWNGVSSGYKIVNGCLGLSGRNTANMYGVKNPDTGKVYWHGSLQLCKKLLAKGLAKRNPSTVEV